MHSEQSYWVKQLKKFQYILLSIYHLKDIDDKHNWTENTNISDI